MNGDIEYKSSNGYSGILFGKSSLLIMGPDGKEVLHTGMRGINTYDELKQAVDTFPTIFEGFRVPIKNNTH